MTQYQYYKRMKELALKKMKTKEGLSKFYASAAEGFENKINQLSILEAEKEITSEQKEILLRCSE